MIYDNETIELRKEIAGHLEGCTPEMGGPVVKVRNPNCDRGIEYLLLGDSVPELGEMRGDRSARVCFPMCRPHTNPVGGNGRRIEWAGARSKCHG